MTVSDIPALIKRINEAITSADDEDHPELMTSAHRRHVARIDVMADARDALSRLTAPVEGLETTAEERTKWKRWPGYITPDDARRILRDITTLTAQLDAERAAKLDMAERLGRSEAAREAAEDALRDVGKLVKPLGLVTILGIIYTALGKGQP